MGTDRRPVGTIVVSIPSSPSRAIAVTSMRCGRTERPGRPRRSTHAPERSRAASRVARRSSPADRRAVRGWAARCRRPGRARPVRSTVTPVARYLHAERRFAHGASRGRPVVRPARSASRPPGRARCSAPVSQRDARHSESRGEDGRERPPASSTRADRGSRRSTAQAVAARCYSFQSMWVASGRLMIADARVVAT